MEYNQPGEMMSGVNPGERLQNAMGDGGPDLGQGGQGLLGGGQPGDRVRGALGGDGPGPDLGQGAGSMDVPDEPGPAVAGRTPLVGTVRRSNGMPVVRDQLSGVMG